MRIRLGQLRRLIETQLDQMKLGIASPYPPGEAFGAEDEPELELGRPFIATGERPDYDPGEDIKSLYRGRHAVDMAGDPMGGNPESTMSVEEPEGLRVTRPYYGRR